MEPPQEFQKKRRRKILTLQQQPANKTSIIIINIDARTDTKPLIEEVSRYVFVVFRFSVNEFKVTLPTYLLAALNSWLQIFWLEGRLR